MMIHNTFHGASSNIYSLRSKLSTKAKMAHNLEKVHILSIFLNTYVLLIYLLKWNHIFQNKKLIKGKMYQPSFAIW